jgi:hypothetical protein
MPQAMTTSNAGSARGIENDDQVGGKDARGETLAG